MCRFDFTWLREVLKNMQEKQNSFKLSYVLWLKICLGSKAAHSHDKPPKQMNSEPILNLKKDKPWKTRLRAVWDADGVSRDAIDLAINSREAGDAWAQPCDVDGFCLHCQVRLGLAAVGSYVVRTLFREVYGSGPVQEYSRVILCDGY